MSPETKVMYFDYPNEPSLTSDVVPMKEEPIKLEWEPAAPSPAPITKQRVVDIYNELPSEKTKGLKAVTVGVDDTEENRYALEQISKAFNDI